MTGTVTALDARRRRAGKAADELAALLILRRAVLIDDELEALRVLHEGVAAGATARQAARAWRERDERIARDVQVLGAGPRLGDIGPVRRRVDLEPLPESAPVEEPAAPEPARVPEPARTSRSTR